MNRFFEFSGSQLRVLVCLSGMLVVLGLFRFLYGYSSVDEQSLKFSVQIGDNDSRYAPPFKVDLNTSPADSLELLPGIGPVLASRIVAYRDSAFFQRPEDILKVRGISRKTYESVKSFIEVPSW